MMNDIHDNLSATERVARVLLSLVLITVTITTEGSLGIFAIVPLLAIYPGLTGLVGHDPLTALLKRAVRYYAGAQIAVPTTHVA
jgi:hypothetical protein